jgi:hypothetical protein
MVKGITQAIVFHFMMRIVTQKQAKTMTLAANQSHIEFKFILLLYIYDQKRVSGGNTEVDFLSLLMDSFAFFKLTCLRFVLYPDLG